MHPDLATQEIISEGVLLQQLVEMEGWGIVKRYADAIAHDLDSWSTLPDDIKTATAKVAEMERRKHAIALFKELIAKVEGVAQQGIETGKSFKAIPTEASKIFKYERSETK